MHASFSRLPSSSPANLINLKGEAQNGLFDVGGNDLRTALRQAAALVKFADGVLRR